MCLLKYRNCSWVATNIQTFSLAPLQDLIPTLANNILAKHHDAKVGIKSCRHTRENVSFMHVCM